MLLGRSDQGFIYVFEEPVRILAVDDDPIMREMATAQLSHPGGEVVTAQDGQEAWDLLDADPHFDLVLSDLEMPRLTGFALCTAIREDARFAGLPVVVLTGREDMFAIDRAYEVGATSFATKPVNWRMLGYQLRYVLRNSRDHEAALAAVRREIEAGEPETPALQEPEPAVATPAEEADPARFLQALFAQSPAQIAAIIAQSDAPEQAGAILQSCADLVAARADEAACAAMAGRKPEPCRRDPTAFGSREEAVRVPVLCDEQAVDGDARDNQSCGDEALSARATGSPVAAMREQLRRDEQRQAGSDSGSGNLPGSFPSNLARSWRSLAAGGRS